MATAAEVPGTYDVVINSQGYVFLDSLEPNLPFRTHRASYSLTPTFVERQNTSGDYGDNQQDFFLTFSQSDWSLGEGQRFFRTDDVRKRRYWQGSSVDVTTEGQVTMRPGVTAVTSSINSDNVYSACAMPTDDTSNGFFFVCGLTKVWRISKAGAVVDWSAHGLGGASGRFGIACDRTNVYVTRNGSKVRWGDANAAPVWADFSTTTDNAESLAFLNNTLYGYRETTASLVKWSSGGALTSVYSWQDARGNAAAASTTAWPSRIRPFGSRLLILRGQRGERFSELWQYDGSSTAKVAEFPANFVAYDFDVSLGTAYIVGAAKSTGLSQIAVYAYDGTSITLIWRAPTASASYSPSLISVSAFDRGIVIFDAVAATISYYDAATQGISTIAAGATLTSPALAQIVAASQATLVTDVAGGAKAYVFPDAATASSAYVISSLVDFDSSLSKRFKAVKVDFDAASDGDGGSVDIAYQLNGVDSSYTTLQTGAVAGTEYAIDQTARSISVKITLNKGTSTNGPKLKRVYVRAVPVQPQFRLRQYVLDVSGRKQVRDSFVRLRSGRKHVKDGAAMAADLLTAVASQTPISITDRFGTFTGILEPDQFELLEIHPGEFVARVTAREV